MESAITIPKGRRRLVAVLQAASDVVQIHDVVHTLEVGRTDAAKLLSRWSKQGWLRRVGPGVYVPVGLDALTDNKVLDDPWILVPVLFESAYIGGRTAAEYWDLTEQIFRDIVVMTEQKVRQKSQYRSGVRFTVKHVKKETNFGTKTIWRGRIRIAVSDIHRTIIDMLDSPNIGSGIQHVSDCLTVYFSHADRDDVKLLDYAIRLGNGAVFKRLGFLAESRRDTASLVEACRVRRTRGNAKLDPDISCARLISRWHLFIPHSWDKATST